MAKAKQVAAALRTIAENLDKEPESEVGTYFLIDVVGNDKQVFLNKARLMPRPVTKKWSPDSLTLTHNFMASSDKYDYALRYYIEIPRNTVCELVEPAKPAVYRCEPLLLEEEEAAIDGVTL